MKILIGIPCMDTVPVGFVESLLYMDKPAAETSVYFEKNSLVYDSRNLISLRAIEDKYDWVLWLDSDMVVPKDALMRLKRVAQTEGVDMVTGLYVKRTLPTDPVLYDVVRPPELNDDGHMVKKIHEYYEYPEDSVFPVEGCGFGCVLTSVPLLKKIWDKWGPAFAPFAWAGEDISFCWRVRQEGETILCDSGVKCGHIGTMVYTDRLLARR